MNASDGQQLWKTSYTQGRYNATSPVVDGQTIIYAGPTKGITAKTLEKQGDVLTAKESWRNNDISLMFNTPVLHDGLLFGLSGLNALFCIDTHNADKAAWTTPLIAPADTPAPPPDQAAGGQSTGTAGSPSSAAPSGGDASPAKANVPGMQGGRGRGMGMRGPGGGYGSVIDAGSVLIALNPSGQLVVFEPSNTEFRELARYKVAEGDTYAYPVLVGNRIYIKDKSSLTLWTLE